MTKKGKGREIDIGTVGVSCATKEKAASLVTKILQSKKVD